MQEKKSEKERYIIHIKYSDLYLMQKDVKDECTYRILVCNMYVQISEQDYFQTHNINFGL